MLIFLKNLRSLCLAMFQGKIYWSINNLGKFNDKAANTSDPTGGVYN